MKEKETFEILKDQIFRSFPDTKITGKDYCGIKCEEHTITVNVKFEIICTFPKIKNLSIDKIRLFFADRIKSPFSETYVDSDKIRIFRRDFRRKKGEKTESTSLSYAMEIYKLFKDVHESHLIFIGYNN